MRKLQDLTEDQYTKLLYIGMLFVIFPDATGNYRDDCEKYNAVFEEH